MKHPEATVGMLWNESKLFSQAKELFVKTFQAAYAGFSEECLGLNGMTKEAWLRQTIDDEEALQTRDPVRYSWLIAHDAGQKVLGIAILDMTPASGQGSLYVRQIAAKQGLGIGKRLVKAIASHCAGEGIHKLYAVTRRINDGSQRFMAKLGFQECNRKEEGYGDKYIGLSAEISPWPLQAASPTSSGPRSMPHPKLRAYSKSASMSECGKCGLQLDTVVFSWNEDDSYEAAQRLLVATFLDAYDSLNEADLGLQVSKQRFLDDVVANELKKRLQNPDRYQWLMASRAGEVIGLLTVDLGDCHWAGAPSSAVIRQLAVASKFQRQDLGMELGLRVLERYPTVFAVKAYTRRNNLASQCFLNKFGFRILNEGSQEFDGSQYLTHFRDLSTPAQKVSDESLSQRAGNKWTGSTFIVGMYPIATKSLDGPSNRSPVFVCHIDSFMHIYIYILDSFYLFFFLY